MLVLNTEILADAFNTATTIEVLMGATDGWIDREDRRKFYGEKFGGLEKELDALGLRVSRRKAGQIRTMLSLDQPFTTLGATQALKQACAALRENMQFELEGQTFYAPTAAYGKYYNQVELFGSDVFKNFPSANEDVFEAGMCLAFERGTACVMHLMRVQEIGLGALATAVNVERKNDWGSYIREIQNEMDRRAKISGARSPDEQFYAEAAANFDRLRRAYRNPTMHPERTYSSERAEEILLAARSFMGFLATRLAE